MDVRPIVSRAPFLPLRHKHASAEETGEWAPERDARWPGRGRPSPHLRARACCSPLEEDSLLDAILLLGNEHLGLGRKRPHQPQDPKTKISSERLSWSYQWINFYVFFKTPPKVKKEDALKISFKSLEARMKWDSRPKQKQNTTRYAILIKKTNRHNSHVPGSMRLQVTLTTFFEFYFLWGFVENRKAWSISLTNTMTFFFLVRLRLRSR